MAKFVPDVLLRRKDVEARTGLSRSSIYQLIKINDFPRQRVIAGRRVAWVEREVSQWIQDRIESSPAKKEVL